MSLIKHLENNIFESTYDEAIAIGRNYKTKNGGKPKVETITRKLRNLVEDKKLVPIRKGKVIIGYTKKWKQTERQQSLIFHRVTSVMSYSGELKDWFEKNYGKYGIDKGSKLEEFLSSLSQNSFQKVLDACDKYENDNEVETLIQVLSGQVKML